MGAHHIKRPRNNTRRVVLALVFLAIANIVIWTWGYYHG